VLENDFGVVNCLQTPPAGGGVSIGGDRARGVLHGTAARRLCAVPRRNDLRGLRGWRGVHFVCAVSHCLDAVGLHAAV